MWLPGRLPRNLSSPCRAFPVPPSRAAGLGRSRGVSWRCRLSAAQTSLTPEDGKGNGRGSLPQRKRAAAGRDVVKEESRQFRRTVFSFDNWVAHRSTRRYARHVLGIFTSRIIRGLAQPILYVVSVAAAVGVYQTALAAGLLPAQLPSLVLSSREPLSLSSFALSLLLVFRTNASYARWDEGRKAWGVVLTRSRDMARQALSWVASSKLRAVLCRWLVAFSRSLLCHLRADVDLEKELKGVLEPEEVEAVLEATHRPLFILQVLSEAVYAARAAGLDGTPAKRMEENLTAMEDSCGSCERILRTPIPLSYTRHTSRFMMIWLTLLPFSLWEPLRWSSLPICGIIAFLLLGIEEIGVSIEEPFSILPLEALCDTLQRNVAELQRMHNAGRGAGAGGRPPPRSAPGLVARALADTEDDSGGTEHRAGWAGAAPAGA